MIAIKFFNENKDSIKKKDKNERPNFRKKFLEEMYDRLSFEEWEWFCQMPYYIELKKINVIVVHAGIKRFVNLLDFVAKIK